MRSRSARPAGRPATALRLGAALTAAILAPRLAIAQTGVPASPAPASPPPSVGECFAFAFGAWTPALDWRAAGHGAAAPGVRLPGEFAARDSAGGENQMILFPSWWPAGVGIHFARPPRLPGDTVQGVAEAFVADGRLRVPRATVRTWLKPCASGAR